MTVIVTGASGFAGGAITRALHDLGQSVLSVGRTDPGIPGVGHIDWDVTRDPSPTVEAAAADNPLVIHAAAAVGIDRDPSEYHSVNVAGTRRVLDTFGGSRIVYLSTAAVYDPTVDHDMLYEEAGPVATARYSTAYEKSKAEAEAVVARVRRRTLVLRPAPLYGRGEKYNLSYLTERIHKGRLELPGGGHHLISLCAVENLVSAALAGLRHRDVAGPVNVTDSAVYEFAEIINPLLARVDLDYVQVDASPADLAKLRARGAGRRLGRGARGRRRWSTFALQRLLHDRTYDISRLRNLLGVEPGQM